MISPQEAAEFLKNSNDILILTHQFPDGDTLGSAAALCCGLQKLNKRVQVKCSDPISSKYKFLFSTVKKQKFIPKMIVAVDIADLQLIGEPNQSLYGEKTDLCIDHHPSNSGYAKQSCVNPNAAATCEIIFDILNILGTDIDKAMADALYTGITTDTGCFKYINVTPLTYRIAADLVEKGANGHKINRLMFDTKSPARMELECNVLNTMEYFCQSRVAVIKITNDMIKSAGASEDDIEGLATIPRSIKGVLVGVTLREKSDGGIKVSLRAQPPLNASKICAAFGGGGHKGAAGCTFHTKMETAQKQILSEVIKYI
jgi:phosphoesterase RecJ-like protein